QDEPGREPKTASRAPPVRHLRLLVGRPAYAVADQIAHHTVPRRFRSGLDRVPDISEPVAGHRLGNAVVERLFGDLEEPAAVVIDLSDAERACRIGVPAVELHPHVHADQVALFEDSPRRWDAVDDLLVHRYAANRRKAVAPLERGDRAVVAPDVIFDEPVDGSSGRPWPNVFREDLEEPADDLARAADRIDLVRRLERDHDSSTFTISRCTSSTGRFPSTYRTGVGLAS